MMQIPRSTYDEPTRPAWIPVRLSGDRPGKPILRCACGDLIGLAAHSVAANGAVTASFYHHWSLEQVAALGLRSQGCGFHEWLVLEGYDGPAFGPGEGR